MSEEKCSNCRFYLELERPREDGEPEHEFISDAGEGVCRRYPPAVFVKHPASLTDSTTREWKHPERDGDDWCGEWQAIKIVK